MRKIILCLLIINSLNTLLSQDRRLEKIDSIISSWYKNNEFNGNILIAEKGNIIFNKSYGKANEETGEMLNENTQFELASVSKQFTATAIMILKERNQLSLDDPITKYFPELINYNKVTIKNLLNHTGGLQHFEEKFKKLDNKNVSLNNELIVKYLIDTKPLFEANSQFDYSNTGYVLLSQIVEKVSKKKLNNFLDENIFQKLEMNKTKLYHSIDKKEILNNYAFGYVYDYETDKWIKCENHPDTEKIIDLYKDIDGAKGVNSTVMDLLKWNNSFVKEEILTKKSIEEMCSPTILNNKKISNFGYGFYIYVHQPTKKKVIEHGGDIPGYKTFLIRLPENDISIILLLNRTAIECKIPYNTILNILDNRNYNIKQNIDLSYIKEDKLRLYEGKYYLKNDTITFKIKGKHLMFIENEEIPIEVKLKDETILINEINRIEIKLKKDKKGNFVKLVLISNGQKRKLNRIS